MFCIHPSLWGLSMPFWPGIYQVSADWLAQLGRVSDYYAGGHGIKTQAGILANLEHPRFGPLGPVVRKPINLIQD